MKNLFLIVFLFPVINSCSQEDSKLSTPELFSKGVSQALIDNDFESFKKLFMNDEDFDFMVEHSYETQEDRNSVKETKNERMGMFNDMIEKTFRVTSPTLKDYQFEKCTYELSSDASDGTEFISNLIIEVKNRNSTKQIVFQRLIKAERGWVSIGMFSTY